MYPTTQKAASKKQAASVLKQSTDEPKTNPNTDVLKAPAPCNSVGSKPKDNVANKTTRYTISDVVNWKLLRQLPERSQIDAMMLCLSRLDRQLSPDGQQALKYECWDFS